MEFLAENWIIIVGILMIGAAAGFAIYKFISSSKEEQLNKVKEWLLWAVTAAEKDLGSGTGKLKLRQVYDLFVVRFPWLVKVVSFTKFSDLVDEALIEMRNLLKTNESVKALVEK